jgi:hypothetical protein
VATVQVNPGVCGLAARIEGVGDEDYTVKLTISSECARVQKLAQQLSSVAALDELMLPMPETTVYRLAASCRLHTACPVPSAILKAIEVAAGMALPAVVHMEITK